MEGAGDATSPGPKGRGGGPEASATERGDIEERAPIHSLHQEPNANLAMPLLFL